MYIWSHGSKKEKQNTYVSGDESDPAAELVLGWFVDISILGA